jgi:hypothetical protein
MGARAGRENSLGKTLAVSWFSAKASLGCRRSNAERFRRLKVTGCGRSSSRFRCVPIAVFDAAWTRIEQNALWTGVTRDERGRQVNSKFRVYSITRGSETILPHSRNPPLPSTTENSPSGLPRHSAPPRGHDYRRLSRQMNRAAK